jgi:hypothetical protein
MTSSGPEATAVSPVLLKLSVTVPAPDSPKVMSSFESTVAWHVAYSSSNCAFPASTSCGFCVNRHDTPALAPGVMVPRITVPALVVRVKVVAPSPTPRVADSPGKPKIVASGKSKVSPARAAPSAAARPTRPFITVSSLPSPQPIRPQAQTNIMQAVPPSSLLRKFQYRMLSLLWCVYLLLYRQCKGAP